jgi:response regulator RpfG family c-di-GMP phosphodiesterase
MKIKILYVDDEPINLKLFEINFARDFEIFVAEDGSNGLNILEKEPDIKVIISDMKMPGMNGIEFIAKAREKYPAKKYYILTGFEITKEIQDAIESGMILKYFRKPFNIKEIRSTIEMVLKT